MNKLEIMKKRGIAMVFTPPEEAPWMVYYDIQNDLYSIRFCIFIIILILSIVYWRKKKRRNRRKKFEKT